MERFIDGELNDYPLAGVLKNSPIKLGKPIITNMGNSTKVIGIEKTAFGIYIIETENQNKYYFDPKVSTKHSDKERKTFGLGTRMDI